jgi:tetratricopeptide (TPR) repeat protein
MILLTGVLFLGLLAKASFTWQLSLPYHWLVRSAYPLFTLTIGIAFIDFALPILQARELELVCTQRLGEIVEDNRHLSGNQMLLNDVIESYAEGCLLHPENADLWIGRSQATAQRFFGNPSIFEAIGQESLIYAQRAVEISPDYARAWSQLGLAYALSGEVKAAEEALLKGIELAPNSSNAHYHWASFAAAFTSKMDSAKRSAKQAVEINPDNLPALRINRKLNIL